MFKILSSISKTIHFTSKVAPASAVSLLVWLDEPVAAPLVDVEVWVLAPCCLDVMDGAGVGRGGIFGAFAVVVSLHEQDADERR